MSEKTNSPESPSSLLDRLENDPLINAKQVADALGMHVVSVRKLSAAGDIPSYLIGRRSRRYRLSEILERRGGTR